MLIPPPPHLTVSINICHLSSAETLWMHTDPPDPWQQACRSLGWGVGSVLVIPCTSSCIWPGWQVETGCGFPWLFVQLMRVGPGWLTWCCHTVPHEGSSILQLHLFVSSGNMALLQLLEPYGMECPDGLPAMQLHITHDVLKMLHHVRQHSTDSFSGDMRDRYRLVIFGRPSCRSIDDLVHPHHLSKNGCVICSELAQWQASFLMDGAASCSDPESSPEIPSLGLVSSSSW